MKYLLYRDNHFKGGQENPKGNNHHTAIRYLNLTDLYFNAGTSLVYSNSNTITVCENHFIKYQIRVLNLDLLLF